jgi:hypothetical protein
MTSLQNVKNAIAIFIEKEMLSRIPDWKKWALGALISITLEKGDKMFHAFKRHPFVVALEIINEDDMIDDELVIRHLLSQAEKSSVSFEVPLIGPITLTEKDVKMLETILHNVS